MKRHCTKTRLICPICGNIQTIFRQSNKCREFGHIKTIWCFKCKEKTNHIEIKDEEIEKTEE